MATEEFKLKPTAIFSTDAAGYTRRKGEDEDATIWTQMITNQLQKLSFHLIAGFSN